MREIKFLAWHKGKKVMGIVTDIHWTDYEIAWVSLTYVDGTGDTHVLINEVVLRAYSGFEDRNRKPIYEGDILTCKNYESGIESKITCQYSYGAFKFNGWLFYDLPDHGYFVEVVGNIYENMDLLEVKVA